MLSGLVLATVFTSAFGAWITIYEHTSFGGKSRTFTDSVYNLKDYGFGDKISSVKVGSGRNWIFYQHHGYRGYSWTATAGNYYYTVPHNDEYSSIRLDTSNCGAGKYHSGKDCAVCPSNTYNPYSKVYSCTKCPTGKMSRAGSTSSSNCYYAPCKAGNYMTSSGCRQCAASTYSGAGASSCTKCPTGKISKAGSTSSSNCYYAPCQAGNYMTSSGCRQCAANTYSGAGASSCTNCPAGKISKAGSTSSSSCTYAPCKAGNYMTSSGCRQCAANTYSGAGASSCTNCPTGKISKAGSTSSSSCTYAPCKAGNYMTTSGCEKCKENTYSGDGATSCTACPTGKVSASGSTSVKDCKSGRSSRKKTKVSEKVEISVTPVKSTVSCKLGKRKCKVMCTVKTNGKLDKKGMQICKYKNGGATDCKAAKYKKKIKKFKRSLKKPTAAEAGQYVCRYTEKDTLVTSALITVTVKA